MKSMAFVMLVALASGCMPAMNATWEDGPPLKQTPPIQTRSFAWYEENKLDKADALALSLFCPGAGFAYAKEPVTGVLSFAANFSLAYACFDAIHGGRRDDGSAFGILMVIGRVADIFLSLKAVGDYNSELRFEAGLTAVRVNGKPEPALSLSLGF